MSRISIEMQGMKRFERKIDKFEQDLIDGAKRIIAETAEKIATQAKALAPVADVDGGNLRSSIDVRYYNNGLSAEIRVGASYGVYVEYGTGIYATEGGGRTTPWIYYSEKLGRFVWTRGMRAQPFFGPAVEQGGKHFEREMNRLGA